MPIINETNAITREKKEKLLKQKSKVIWFTGLPCSGKSTLASNLETQLLNNNLTSVIIDGDFIRNNLNKDLGFSVTDREENIRRVAEISKFLINNGIIVIVCLVSPLIYLRTLAKDIIGADDFIEVYVNAPLSVCENRDVKGMYKKARLGTIKQFTGIDAVYEAPENPYIEIHTANLNLNESINYLNEKLLPLLV